MLFPPRRIGICDATFYHWKAKYGWLERLKSSHPARTGKHIFAKLILALTRPSPLARLEQEPDHKCQLSWRVLARVDREADRTVPARVRR